MSAQKYTYDDTVRWTQTGEVGVVRAVQHGSAGFVYGVYFKTETDEVVAEVAEEELELVKMANADETGFNPTRYVT